MKDKDGNVTEEKIDDEYYDVPMAVLVNGYSASASEILAGAIRDNHAGLLVGTRPSARVLCKALWNLPTEAA